MEKAKKIALEILRLVKLDYEFPDAEWEATKNIKYTDKDQQNMNNVYDTL